MVAEWESLCALYQNSRDTAKTDCGYACNDALLTCMLKTAETCTDPAVLAAQCGSITNDDICLLDNCGGEDTGEATGGATGTSN